MDKTFTVATEIQKVLMKEVLLPEIALGFWKDARPADHADYWIDVSIEVGPDLGVKNFEMPRNYNFVNPDFFRKTEARLMAAAQLVNPEITVKQLKKQLITLNQIIGGRLTQIGGTIAKLPRGRKSGTQTAPTSTTKSDTVVRRAPATFSEPKETERV